MNWAPADLFVELPKCEGAGSASPSAPATASR
mgnify:CR=1 FL=1